MYITIYICICTCSFPCRTRNNVYKIKIELAQGRIFSVFLYCLSSKTAKKALYSAIR